MAQKGGSKKQKSSGECLAQRSRTEKNKIAAIRRINRRKARWTIDQTPPRPHLVGQKRRNAQRKRRHELLKAMSQRRMNQESEKAQAISA